MGETPDKTKDKNGKRSYTLSPEALKQRRGAAYKHGQYAEHPANALGHPCKPSLCPAGEDCDAKRKVEEAGGVLSTCVVDLASGADHIELFKTAIETGELEGLATIYATLLGSSSTLAVAEIEKLLGEGLASEITIESPAGDVVSKLVQNPRAEPLLKFLKLLGATAAEQQLTPRSRAEGDLAGAQTSTLEWQLQMWEATQEALGGEE